MTAVRAPGLKPFLKLHQVLRQGPNRSFSGEMPHRKILPDFYSSNFSAKTRAMTTVRAPGLL